MIEYRRIQIEEQELNYLSQDENMKLLIELAGDIHRDYMPDPFIALINSIVFQQLAYKAAITIWNRFEQLLEAVTPESILNHSFEELRGCGLSKNKIDYIKNISAAIIEGRLDINNINKMYNEEIIENLIRIKGIGEWTAEMFLIFSLNRKDILSYKDLAIRRGIQWLYGLDAEPTKVEFEIYREKFSPYNTTASFYLWEITIRNLFRYDNIQQAFATEKNKLAVETINDK